jgi:predicted signal transduction protein with EAL and GGDEF domain
MAANAVDFRSKSSPIPSCNLSAHDICAPDGILPLIALIHSSGVSPQRIDFEITETAVMFDFARAQQSIAALKAMGCSISLDDFGTGYSSLSHVHRLPLDKIKVDRSFVADVTDNPVSHKIIKSLTGLCADMEIACVVEGVETRAQLDSLRRLGCDHIQGYYFARPMHGECSLRLSGAGATTPQRRDAACRAGVSRRLRHSSPRWDAAAASSEAKRSRPERA